MEQKDEEKIIREYGKVSREILDIINQKRKKENNKK